MDTPSGLTWAEFVAITKTGLRWNTKIWMRKDRYRAYVK